jgi:hypothetical protein
VQPGCVPAAAQQLGVLRLQHQGLAAVAAAHAAPLHLDRELAPAGALGGRKHGGAAALAQLLAQLEVALEFSGAAGAGDAGGRGRAAAVDQRKGVQ